MANPDRNETSFGAHLGDPGLPQSNIRIIETEFPTDLEGRMNAVLASFNIAPKTVTFLLLDRNWTSPNTLKQRFVEIHKDSEINKFSQHRGTNQALNYTTQSLCPIGLVTQQIRSIGPDGKDKVLGVSLTEAGMKYGQPAAAKILSFEARGIRGLEEKTLGYEEEKFSLYSIFGSTNSNEGTTSRAPYNRYRILMALRKGAQTMPEITEKTGINHSLLLVELQALAKKHAEAVSFTSFHTSTGEGQPEFQRNQEVGIADLSFREIEQNLTRTIATLCETLEGPITITSIYDILPEDLKIRIPGKRDIRHRISDSLVKLKRQNFFAGGEHSSVSLTERGRSIVEELLVPLEEAMLDGPLLNDWKTILLPEVQRDLVLYATIAGNQYYPFSRSFNRSNPDAIKNMVFDVFQNKSADPDIYTSPAEIAMLTGLSLNSVRRELVKLQADQEIDVETSIKGVSRYRLRNPEQDISDINDQLPADMEEGEEYQLAENEE